MLDVVANQDKSIVVKQLRYGRDNEVLVVDEWQLNPAEH